MSNPDQIRLQKLLSDRENLLASRKTKFQNSKITTEKMMDQAFKIFNSKTVKYYFEAFNRNALDSHHLETQENQVNSNLKNIKNENFQIKEEILEVENEISAAKQKLRHQMMEALELEQMMESQVENEEVLLNGEENRLNCSVHNTAIEKVEPLDKVEYKFLLNEAKTFEAQ